MGGGPPRDEDDYPEPKRLRHLRWLVNALTLTLIAGVLIIAATLVIRLTAAPPPPPALPGHVVLPAGETARAVTFGGDWIAVVTEDGRGRERIRVLDATSGQERASVAIEPAE